MKVRFEQNKYLITGTMRVLINYSEDEMVENELFIYVETKIFLFKIYFESMFLT